jgi:hypothetical protein
MGQKGPPAGMDAKPMGKTAVLSQACHSNESLVNHLSKVVFKVDKSGTRVPLFFRVSGYRHHLQNFFLSWHTEFHS